MFLKEEITEDQPFFTIFYDELILLGQKKSSRRNHKHNVQFYLDCLHGSGLCNRSEISFYLECFYRFSYNLGFYPLLQVKLIYCDEGFYQ